MKPFLILQLRKNDAASDGEYQAFLKYGGLTESEVQRIRMEIDALPVINLDDYSGVIVGGGPWNVSDHDKDTKQREAEAWLFELLRNIVTKDKPYLGACYGFGALTVARLGEVAKGRYQENAGAVTIELTNEGTEDPLLKNLPQNFKAIVGHKEACQSLPKKAVWLASSETCPYQMYRIGNNVYATQFHPELDGEGAATRIDVYKHAGYFPPEEAEELKSKLRKEALTVPMEILRRFIQNYR
ncbi:glutamine amidotransferase [Candidatus Uhrbacteria bacterium CG_4_9_14_3_um_filter_50_9]|uniref:Glutamine amidotransferase n=1 Tax=Candidatus Uhrbacteria bacterium CG_4_9_14_3_um_filter_50_9 TaxID=1975035 RepID=A0A2M7XC25_9BACT|nr:MAG: glutamine amidotransferase [Candidatus Uhrbacteria bacterium CG_4_9_14_3_um_filter_50_9]